MRWIRPRCWRCRKRFWPFDERQERDGRCDRCRRLDAATAAMPD